MLISISVPEADMNVSAPPELSVNTYVETVKQLLGTKLMTGGVTDLALPDCAKSYV